VGLCILLYNVSVVFYKGYLRTDAAAIGLLKTSMQESFEEDATTAKPVKVLDVRLEGKGVNRTGSAVVMLAGERKLLPFEATVKKSGRGVEVSWEIVESLPRSQPQTETLKSQRAPSASPSRTSQPSVRQSGAAQPSVPHTDRDYKRHLQALLETASAIDTTEIILLGRDSELDDAKVNQQLDKLREAWTAVADEAEWLVQAL
jgi:hypothetical protein